ncbi:hypothetical protein BDV32DRAFT_117447 [Aspergillus pseudonomiae]|nr:hypothetical protein BDV32DRAFT_117447 [Aspergillus pseudonomiae]
MCLYGWFLGGSEYLVQHLTTQRRMHAIHGHQSSPVPLLILVLYYMFSVCLASFGAFEFICIYITLSTSGVVCKLHG